MTGHGTRFASSPDLVNWMPQNYPMLGRGPCLDPEASYNPRTDSYLVTWLNVSDGDTTVMGCMTKDFMKYSAARPVPGNTRLGSRCRVQSVNPRSMGTIHRVHRSLVDGLERNQEAVSYRNALYGEKPSDDARRFKDIKRVSAVLDGSGVEPYAISPMLMGVFFEDISRAADGGLYAELIENRDFEYCPGERGGDKTWHARHSWGITGDGIGFEIDTVMPIHPNNPHYAVVVSNGQEGALHNTGFNGIALKKGERYDLSMFVRRGGDKGVKLRVSLVGKDGHVYASATLGTPGKDWRKFACTLTSDSDTPDARLSIEPLGKGETDIDMVSLFPRNTFKGRRNGLRADLAEAIAELKPRFVRFPGGCVAHGNGIDNIYRWKNTIGPLEARVPQFNLWGYHQTAGLGYHEYFQFCEDINAAPLPVIAAGVPCQNSSHGGAGQQGGVKIEDMPTFIQDILDLVEYANGDARKTRWGGERARNGHPAPFGLKYIGIGNEDLISDVFKERFEMIYNALKEKHPEITVIGTVGPFHSGSDYSEGWRFATKLGVPMVDEHYYESPSWFVYNQDFYDGYDRKGPHVYLGEYASRGNELYNALAEAAYLCGVERNGDVVEMTSYAPLLAKEGFTNWNPDLIYFTNTEVKPTVNYEVQRLFGQNAGTAYIPAALTHEGDNRRDVKARLASSVVTTADGDVVVKLVNLLPAPTDVDLILPQLDGMNTIVEKIVLTGEIKGRDARAVTTREDVGKRIELPPYSLTVLRWSK